MSFTSDLLKKWEESLASFKNSPLEVTMSPHSFKTRTSTYKSLGGSKSFVIFYTQLNRY